MPDTSTETRLAKVNPVLAKKVRGIIESAKFQGIEFRVVQGLRTYAEQDALYAQGRTKPGHVVTNARGGSSNHNFGLACDLCPFKGGQPQWNDNKSFLLLGELATLHGLSWGGNWHKLIDKPHVELPGLTIAECRELYQQGELLAVWSSPKLAKE